MFGRDGFENEDFSWAGVKERLLEVPASSDRTIWFIRVGGMVLLLLWALSVLTAKLTEMPTFLHLTVILFHEAGHIFFMPFGDVARVAGGTLGQLIMPMICMVALFRNRDNYGTAACAVWLFMSLVDAAVYAFDAADPMLPLIGGGTGADSFHDFVFLFDRFGQLAHATAWAYAMKTMAAVGLALSFGWAAVLLFLEAEQIKS